MKTCTMKKLLAVLLTALLAFSVLSLTVLADEADADADASADAVETVNGEDADDAVIGGADGPTAVLVASSDSGITFDRLPANLGRMGVGMVCIIAVMGVLILVTMLLNKITAPKDKK